jgi:hypothetical protein
MVQTEYSEAGTGIRTELGLLCTEETRVLWLLSSNMKGSSVAKAR